MIIDPQLGKQETLELLTRFMTHMEADSALWRLDDPEDLGSFRMLCTNHAVSRSAGVSVEDDVGRSMRETYPAMLDTGVLDLYVQVLQTQEPLTLPALVYGDDRLPDRVYHMVLHPVTDDTVGLVIHNVTDRVRAEKLRDIAMAELERSNQELEDFAYVASHDLQAPLRDIENLATWIGEDAGDALPAESAAHLDTLRTRAARMQRLLDDLLEYSRAGRVPATVEAIDVLDLLEDVRTLLAVPEGYEVVLPAAGPTIQTPKTVLTRVLMNLLSNAIKHRGTSGRRVEVQVEEAGEQVAFTVVDDGPGIDPRYHKKVFQLFSTLRPRDEVEGSGMGLALVQKLVESQGGAIELTSAAGAGCSFRFTWPRTWTKRLL